MKNVSIKSLALVVMSVTVYASSWKHVKDPKDMLRLISEEAENMSIDKTMYVEKAAGASTTCVTHFFCRAEWALNRRNLTELKLTRLLHQYNKLPHNHKMNENKCHTDPEEMTTMGEFLNDTVLCANSALVTKKPGTN